MTTISVDFEKSNGVIRPLQGVNNGPITYGSLCDSTRYFKEIAVPWARLHDPNWPHPREVDIPQIFPDFDADPEDSASYDFDRTDTYIKSVLDTGAKIVYRLGTSIEHTARVYYARPPEDFTKWAKICLGIIKHYNNGWTDGFRYGISHWEIWNEAPNATMWFGGTWEQYLELYAIAAVAIKSFDPSLKVGGPAASSFLQVPSFIAYCRDHRLPLDFLSWHCYGYSLDTPREETRKIRVLLDEHGFPDAECHLNEWNYWPKGDGWADVYSRREFFEEAKKEAGSGFAASMLILMQDEAVDVMNYYDAQPTSWFCGLFDIYGIPQKTFYAFKAFREMLDYPERVWTGSDQESCCLAAIDRNKSSAAILIARFSPEPDDINIDLRNLSFQCGSVCEVRLIDKDHNFEQVKKEQMNEAGSINLSFAGYTVAMVTFRPCE